MGALCALHCILNAFVAIDSTTSQPSLCANNGSFTVYAHTNAPPLVYTIIDGPQTAALQSSPQFTDLAPGVYQLVASNFNNEADTMFVSVFGNYQYPDFLPVATASACANGNDGAISTTINPGTGLGPLQWQLFSNNTLITNQATGNFNQLQQGIYNVKVTDACLNTTVHTVTVLQGNSSIYINSGILNTVVDCYATQLSFRLLSQSIDRQVSIRISTKNGTYTQPLVYDTITGETTQTIPGIGYGDTVNITLYNSCGDSYNYPHRIPAFNEMGTSYYNGYNNCQPVLPWVGFSLPNTFLRNPVHYTIADYPQGTVVYQNTINDAMGVSLTGYPANHMYTVTITDGCNNTFIDTITWPGIQQLPPAIQKGYYNLYCSDSTAAITISFSNFHGPVSLRLLGGPSVATNTKPKYGFNAAYGYNASIPAGQVSYFSIKNLVAGVYTFRIYDNCGNSITDTFEITPQMLGDDNYKLSYQPGCPGQNSLLINLFTRADTTLFKGTSGNVTVRQLSTGNIVFNNFPFYYGSYSPATQLVVPYLESGAYQVKIEYGGYDQNFSYKPTMGLGCTVLYDTIVIPPYQRPRITSATRIKCHGQVAVELLCDSTRGVFPYTYEIISGPQTMPPQYSNLFNLSLTGSYIARITDSCGNSNTLNFSIDTLIFPPIFKNGSSCVGGTVHLSYPHSSYFTYRWQKPGGGYYWGDTLTIYNTTIADLGTYTITRFVSINGCTDSFTTTYQLIQSAEYYVYDTICLGSSYQFGNNTYYQSGTYRHNFATTGCDSFVTLYLLADYLRDTITQVLCPGQSFTLGAHTYTQPGIYRDTVTTTACHALHLLYLQGSDYKRGYTNIVTCTGKPYTFNGKTFTATGIYRDTLAATTGCDSVSTLFLTVTGYLNGTTSPVICAGKTYTQGQHTYTQSGTYLDTLTNANGCDSIVTTLLTVLPYPHSHIAATICNGETFNIGPVGYTVAGNYTDTIAINATACDTIYHLTLTVNPIPAGDTALQTFEMKYGDTLQLYACATDSAYLWSGGNCLTCNSVMVAPAVEYAPYTCTVTNSYNCAITCHYLVHVKGLYGDIFVPNAFTPNGDGNNDGWNIMGNNLRLVRLLVFNRWGEIVFESADINQGWDGTFKGTPAPAGVYIYTMQYFGGISTRASQLKGSVTLIR